MNKVLDKILSPQLFAVCYLPWLAINMVSVINVLGFTRVFLVIFAIWAVAICVKLYLFKGRSPWIDKGMALLLFFLAACLFSQLLQFEYGGINMIGKLCFFSICILILYSQHGQGTDDYIKLLGITSRVMGITIGIMMLVSDWMFIDLFSATVVGRSGATIKIGFAENRLFGIFTSPNVGGMYALILIWCSLLTLKWAKNMRFKNFWRVISVIQLLLAMMYISVALSRGTYISGIALVASYLAFRAPFAKERDLKAFKQVGIRVLSIAAIIALCVVSLNVINKVSCEIMELNYESKSANSSEDKNAEMLAIIENAKLGSEGRVEAGRDDIDITNKRASIWKSHITLLNGKHILIGVNQPLQYMEKGIENGKTFTDLQRTFVKYANGNLHNGYLQILINGGLLALIPMAVFLIMCVIKVFKYLYLSLFTGRLSTDTSFYELFSVTLPMVLTILINNVFETNFVLMGANFIQAVFWFAAGACVCSLMQAKKEQEQ